MARGSSEVTVRGEKTLSPVGILRLLARVRPHAGKLAIATTCLLLAGGVGLAFPLFVGKLLDAAFLNKNETLLDRIALGLLALFAAQALLNATQVYLLSATAERVIAKLRTDLFAHS